jgi:hypothetical protein
MGRGLRLPQGRVRTLWTRQSEPDGNRTQIHRAYSPQTTLFLYDQLSSFLLCLLGAKPQPVFIEKRCMPAYTDGNIKQPHLLTDPPLNSQLENTERAHTGMQPFELLISCSARPSVETVHAPNRLNLKSLQTLPMLRTCPLF